MGKRMDRVPVDPAGRGARTYRRRVSAAGLTPFRVVCQETDLMVLADRPLIAETREIVLAGRGYIETYIQRHPDFTRRILEKINFSRKLKDVPKIAGAHHEKIDGSGYPQGLKDKEIPKLSKILAVCDVFDALTSQRPYRDRMNFFKVLNIINKGAGTDFDDFFVAALKKIRLDRLLVILEDENKEKIRTGDLKFLSSYTLTDLMFANMEEETTLEQQKLLTVFTKYYTQLFLDSE